MNKNATLVFHPDNSSLNNTEHTDIPELDTQTANQLLDNVFAACDMGPSVVPVEVLESWGNYKKHGFNLGRTLAYIFLIVLILLPLMFFRPSIIAERTDVKSASDAIYSIHIKTLLPLHSVSATINGTPVRLQEEGSKEFKAAISDNGTLKIKQSLSTDRWPPGSTRSVISTKKSRFLRILIPKTVISTWKLWIPIPVSTIRISADTHRITLTQKPE